MKPLNELNKEEILSGEIFEEILNEENKTKMADLISDLKLKAKDLGVKGLFDEKLKTYQEIDRETKRQYTGSASINNSPTDSSVADVLQLLDYKIEYDNDGNEKSRKLQQTVRNFEIIMDNDNRFAGKIKFDEFSRQEYLMGKVPWESETCDRAWGSHDDAALYSIIQTDYGIKNRNDYFDAIKNVSMRNKFHPVRDILDGLEFDGEEHIRSLLPDYLGVEDTEYSYQVMRLWMLGAVARVYEPGCKFDYTMIFTGPQGLGKSTFLKMMALNDSWFNDSLDSLDSDKAAQSLMGSWIVELAELKSLARTAGGVESVKRFLTAVQDKYRVPYERRADIFLRQCVFAGTTNKSDFLQDETGNRRFLIIQTGVNNPTKSLFVPEAIEDMKAAWAQAVHIWKTEQPELILPDSCRDEARRLQDESMADDGKVGIITQFLENKQRTCVLEIWKEALEENGRPQKWQSSEISDIILSLPNWARVKSPTRYKEYGVQKLFQKKLPSNQNLATNCIPSATNSSKNGEISEDGSQKSTDGFMSLDDFSQEELPFQ
ncbi:MAG: virulence-associated E family protein [Lachnospiraceae bacterium]|nr:virulence-associated E family protein [Lachnospiraceae bacterium]